MHGIMHWIFDSDPVLHHKLSGIRLRPYDADAVDGLRLRHVDHHPLGMQRIAFAREVLGKIRIALPVGALIAIGETREAGIGSAIVSRKAAMRQRISIGITDGIARCGRASEVAFFAGLTPCALRIPMPGLNGEFGVVTVGNRLPAGSQSAAQIRLDQVVVNCLGRDAIDAGTESFVGTKAIGGAVRRDIDVDGLALGEHAEKQQQ